MATDFPLLLLLYLASFIVELGLLTLLLLLSKRMLSWTTKGVFDVSEISKGNVAVSLLFASAIFSIIFWCWPYINEFVLGLATGITGGTFNPTMIITRLFNLIVYLVFMVLLVTLSVRGCGLILKGGDLGDKIKKGNVAVAIILSLAILLLAIIFSPLFSSALVDLEAVLLGNVLTVKG